LVIANTYSGGWDKGFVLIVYRNNHAGEQEEVTNKYGGSILQ